MPPEIKPLLVLVDEDGKVLSEHRDLPRAPRVEYSFRSRQARRERQGTSGSARDMTWDRENQRHVCCGVRRPFYHLRGCIRRIPD